MRTTITRGQWVAMGVAAGHLDRRASRTTAVIKEVVDLFRAVVGGDGKGGLDRYIEGVERRIGSRFTPFGVASHLMSIADRVVKAVPDILSARSRDGLVDIVSLAVGKDEIRAATGKAGRVAAVEVAKAIEMLFAAVQMVGRAAGPDVMRAWQEIEQGKHPGAASVEDVLPKFVGDPHVQVSESAASPDEDIDMFLGGKLTPEQYKTRMREFSTAAEVLGMNEFVRTACRVVEQGTGRRAASSPYFSIDIQMYLGVDGFYSPDEVSAVEGIPPSEATVEYIYHRARPGGRPSGYSLGDPPEPESAEIVKVIVDGQDVSHLCDFDEVAARYEDTMIEEAQGEVERSRYPDI